jgi:hypothetical protein
LHNALHFICAPAVAVDLLTSFRAASACLAGTPFEVQAEAWSWAPSSTNTLAQQQQLPAGHLGGLMVNAVTCRLTAGSGPALLKLHLQGSAAQPTVLELALQVEAGPVAPDGLWLRQVTLEPAQHAAAAAARGGAAAASGVGQPLDVEFAGVLQDRVSWQFLPEVQEEPGLAAAAAGEAEEEDASEEQQDDEDMHDADAAVAAAAGPAAAAVRIKPDPEPVPAQQQQHPQQQQQSEVIELLDTDSDDEVAIVDHPPPPPQQQPDQQQQQQPPEPAQAPPAVRRRRQQQLSARARQLAALSPASAALLYQLPRLAEGSVLRLAVQLRDAAGQQISADRPGKLRLLHHKGWQQQQQQGSAEEVGLVSISKGKAELHLRIGIGDAWIGEQLFEIAPAAPTTQLAAAAAAAGNELSKALPVLLKLSVVQGNHPSELKLKSNLAAAAGCFLVAADQAAAAAAPAGVLRQYSTDSINASLANCQLHSPAAAAAPVLPADVLMLQLQDDSTIPPAAAVPSELPAFRVGISARDGQPLPLQGLAPLQLQLLKWQPPQQQQQQGAALHPDNCWAPVAGCSVQVGATLPAAPAAAAEGAEEEGQLPGEDADSAAAAAAAVEPEYVFGPGCVELPRQAGLYKLAAAYSAQQQRGRAAPGELPRLGGQRKVDTVQNMHQCNERDIVVQLLVPLAFVMVLVSCKCFAVGRGTASCSLYKRPNSSNVGPLFTC